MLIVGVSSIPHLKNRNDGQGLGIFVYEPQSNFKCLYFNHSLFRSLLRKAILQLMHSPDINAKKLLCIFLFSFKTLVLSKWS